MCKKLNPAADMKLGFENSVTLKKDMPTSGVRTQNMTTSREEEQMLGGQGLRHESKSHLLAAKLEVLQDALNRQSWEETKMYHQDATMLGATKKQLSALYAGHLKETVSRSASTSEIEELQTKLEQLGASPDDLNQAFQVGAEVFQVTPIKLK